MSKRDQIFDLWTNDPAFRGRFRADPEGALADAGIELTAEERDALRSLDLGGSDEALADRINPKNC